MIAYLEGTVHAPAARWGAVRCIGLGWWGGMPEISRFLGISILMYLKDHPPPHFHVVYNDFRASVSIADLSIMQGKLPRRVLALVLEWAFQHRQSLQDTWDRLESTGEHGRIPPLE